MPDVAVADVLRIVFQCRAGDQLGLNVRHYKCTAIVGVGSVDLLAIATAFYVNFNSLYTQLLSEHALFEGTSCQRVSPDETSTYASTDAGIPGESVGDLLPRQVSGMITLYSPLIGRKNRGRCYVPFPGEAANDVDSTPVAGYVTVLQELADLLAAPQDISAGSATATLVPVIRHADATSETQLDRGVARDKWATQRRRGSYGRANP